MSRVPDGPSRSRHRTGRRLARGFLSVLVVSALASTAVVVALNRFDGRATLTEGCTATDGEMAWHLSTAQADNAATITAVSLRRGLPARAATIGIATALQESKLVNIDYGDRDSIGLFQQRPSQGWGTVQEIMDPIYSTNAFYDALVALDGYEQMAVTDAAQSVQRSGYPTAYAQHEARSRAWASALTGHSPAAMTCTLSPVADDAAVAPEVFTARVDRDLGDVAIQTVGTSHVIDAVPLDPQDATRASWAMGQWSVAVAKETGVDAVQVADQRWTRSSARWTTVSEVVAQGRVRVEVTAPPTP